MLSENPFVSFRRICYTVGSEILFYTDFFRMGEMKKILIMEDEKPLARALGLKLTHAGFDVKSAVNGEEGLSILERESFDLILSDLVMPKVDGFAVLEALKTRGVTTSVIVLTNLSQTEDERRARLLGAADFFVKSDMPIAKIVERVRGILLFSSESPKGL